MFEGTPRIFRCLLVAATFGALAFARTSLGQGSLAPPGPPAPTMKTLNQIGAGVDQANTTIEQINTTVAQTNSTVEQVSTKLDQVDAKPEKRIPIDAAHTGGDNSTSTFIISAAGSYYLIGNVIGSAGMNGITIQSDNVTVDLNGFTLSGGSAASQAGISVPASQKNIAVRNGVVAGWGNTGVDGFYCDSMIVDRVRASDNGASGPSVGHGISVGANGQVMHCVAQGNSATGIFASSNSLVLDCATYQNRNGGIAVNNHCRVVQCIANSCTGPKKPDVGIGISGLSGTTIENCTANNNTNDGIQVVFDCTVTANRASGNGAGTSASGIHATTGCRVDGNHVNGNTGNGILVDGTGNLIARNDAHANVAGGNYKIVAGNRYGPIIDITAANPAAINGDSGASTLNDSSGGSHPWANFTY